MLNDLELYRDCGRKCAKARNEGDEARAMFEKDYGDRMIRLETAMDRSLAILEFDTGYREVRRVPTYAAYS